VDRALDKRPIIAIEGEHMLGNRVGMGQYMAGVLDGMTATDRDERFVVFALGRAERMAYAPEGSDGVSYRVRPFSRRLHERLLMAGLAPPTELLIGLRPDVCIWPNFVSWPTLPGVRNIVVIHDLGFVFHGEYLKERDRAYFNRMVPRSLRHADRVVAVSESVRDELSAQFGTPTQEIAVISPAVDTTRFRPRDEEEVRRVAETYGLRRPYILYTGTLEPRKNIVGLLDAYAALPRALHERFQLVLAGGKGWLDVEIERRLNELAELGIVTTGYVPDADLPAIYSGAELFVYPSFYEGFGMPPLEAMACGVPVITSDVSSLPEVVGDAAIKLDPTDTRAISAAIELVLTDAARAASMHERGLHRAKHFTWATSAQRMDRLVGELLAERR
jgi:glycosyltransferase involved in cell wall biosynthesis